MVMRIYNPIWQQEIFPKNINAIKRIIFGVDSEYSSE